MPESLSNIRDRIHRKSHEYFTFDYSRRESSRLRMFYGATDALLDASMAATAFGAAVRSDPAIDLLVCYGFLQAIYIQQDAVWTLSRSLGLEWTPNDDLRIIEIRDIRNRLTGHPAAAGEKAKPRLLSSAIISYDHVRPEGFRGHIYFEDEVRPIEVNVESVLKENEARLLVQMQKIEKQMDDNERLFRAEQAKTPLSGNFGQGFDYLVQRLHCDLNDEGRLPQAQTRVQMIRDRLLSLRKDLEDLAFASSATAHHLDHIFTGLEILDGIMRQKDHSEATQHQFHLIFDGVEKHLKNLGSLIDELDTHLRAAI